METALVTNRDFIIFGLQPWDIAIGSNCKNIAAEISLHNRVLYVNRPLDRINKLRNSKHPQTRNRINSIKEGRDELTQVQPNLWVMNPGVVVESINFLPEGFLYRALNKRNNKMLAGEIIKSSGKLRFKDPILIIDDDFFNGLYLKEFLQPAMFIYYIRDFLLSQKYFVKHGHSSEPIMIAKADAVAANSKYLADYAAKYNAVVADAGQGCDVDDFIRIPGSVPVDVANIPFPRIGYCGSLTSTRLDINLIEYIATCKKEWNIVLVGPEDEVFKNSRLHKLSNVYFTGSKEPAELPAYTHAFDVCINPQLLNQMTIGNYPRKVDEYLAAGKPVVATKTVAMEMFAAQTYLCKSNEDYIEQIEKALHESQDADKISNRKKFAQSHTWAASVAVIYKLIKNHHS